MIEEGITRCLMVEVEEDKENDFRGERRMRVSSLAI